MPLPIDEPNDEEELEQEVNDFDTPFSPPDEKRVDIEDWDEELGTRFDLDPTHPITDTNIELEELYDEGISGAAEASEPNAGDAVIGYKRPQAKEAAMATTKQREAARENIKKAQATWKSMTHRQHALAQPEGRGRARPGTRGGGEYYRIEVRPKKEFVTFRVQDVGDKGHLERLAGKRTSGSWSTHAWLVSKDDAHISGSTLVADSSDARELFAKLGSEPMHVKGDIFKAKDRRNVPEREKPTTAQQKARIANIKKAQAARRSK